MICLQQRKLKVTRNLLKIFCWVQKTGNVTIADEVEMYLSSRSINIFEWWKLNEPRYPNIARLAKSMLCIQATSTAAERIFSSAGITISKGEAA